MAGYSSDRRWPQSLHPPRPGLSSLPVARRAQPWVVIVLGVACGGEPASPAPAQRSEPSAEHERPGPAPTTEVGFGRTVVELLAREDWDAYDDLLATRADMIGVFSGHERDSRRERRNQRRTVWRRVNDLRGGEAKRAWDEALREARARSLPWSEVELADVRRSPSSNRRLPEDAQAYELLVVLEHEGTRLWLDLGTCVKTSRGWVTLDSMSLREEGTRGPGESLLHPDEGASADPR